MRTRNAGTALGDETHARHNSENPAPEAGMSRDVINIGLNMFRAGIRRYSEPEQELLEWLWGYTFDVLGNSKIELERALGYDYKFIYDVLTGAFDGSLETFCSAIINLKAKAAQKMPLVGTIVTKRITEALDYARDFSAMVTIQGPTGRGKTYTARYWARMNNHGRTRYVRVPSGCTRRVLVTLLCQQCGIGTAGLKTSQLELRLFKAFTARNVIIADEAGHLIPRTGSGSTAAIELLRDLHDMTGCAVVMIFTDVYLSRMKTGEQADYFEQFFGRIKFQLTIPERVFRSEVEEVVKSFLPDPPARMIEYAYSLALQRDGKLRTLFEDLLRASEWAARQNRALGFDDLRLAVDWRRSGGVWPEE